MMRNSISISLLALVLIAQIGIPFRKHYCNGMLQSVSLFAKSGCTSHACESESNGTLTADPCCKSKVIPDFLSTTECSFSGKTCCEEEVTVLMEEADATIRQLDGWEIPMTVPGAIVADRPAVVTDVVTAWQMDGPPSNAPPRYILFASLILYA